MSLLGGINLYSSSSSSTPGFNSTNSPVPDTVIIANVTNQITGLPSGIEVLLLGGTPTKSSSGGLTGADYYGIPKNCLNNWWQFNSGTTYQFLIREISASTTELTIGNQIYIQFGAAGTTGRSITMSAAGGGSGTITWPNRTVPVTPEPPAAFLTTIEDDGTGRARILVDVVASGSNTPLGWFRFFDAPTISSIGDGRVKINGTHTVTINGFTPHHGTIDGVPLAAVTATTITIPAHADGAQSPRSGYREVILYDADNLLSASYWVYVEPADGYMTTIIRNVSNAGDGFLKKYITELAADDEVTFLLPAYFDPPIELNAVDVDGAIRSDFVGTQIINVRSISTGIVEFYSVITDGVSPPVVIKTRTISASRIKSSFLKGNYLKGNVL
jgi:hypothetical protein